MPGLENVTVIPEICVHDARGAIDFYRRAFGAKDLGTHATPDGKKIMHCGLGLNGGVVFVCDDFEESRGGKARSPAALGGSPVTIHLNCGNVQATWDAAVRAGARVLLPLEEQFWGDTYGVLTDPFGQRWSMSGSRSAPKPDVTGSDYESGAKRLYPTKRASKTKATAKAKPKATANAKAKATPKKRAARGR
jgi:PhnB protein